MATLVALGQKRTESYPYVDLAYGFGAHSISEPSLQAIIGKWPSYHSLETRISMQTTGKDLYSFLWRYPRWFLGYSGHFLGNDSIFGSPNAVFMGIDVPFKRWSGHQKLTFSYVLGGGLSYNFRPNNGRDNPWNTVIGSYNNVYIEVGFYANYRTGRFLDMDFGLGFTHFSNGSNNLPNKGINMMGAKVRLRNNLRREMPVYHMDFQLDPHVRKHGMTFQVGVGSKQREWNGEVNYLITSFSGYYDYHAFRKGKFFAGVELFHDPSIPGLKELNPYYAPQLQGPVSVGLFVGYAAHYNRWHFLSGMGYHVVRGTTLDPALYQRFGIRYRVFYGLYAGVGLKAYNFGQADFVEWSLGYSLFE